ncbi:MAG: zf-HC2 domain-containing protein [Lachnospiraceae bacterium]|nr:zf-HC2 domain-containing protein [Lachnospiraceae bacterium]
MKCNEARRMVVPFVKKELSERDTEAFLAHIESCEDCMDELDIYYIAYHALNAMDQNTHHEYDFKKMLREEIRSARRTILKHKIAKISHVILVLLAELLLILSVITGVRIKRGLSSDSIFERAILRMYMQQRDSTAEELESETENAAGTMETETNAGAAEAETNAGAAEAETAAGAMEAETTAGAMKTESTAGAAETETTAGTTKAEETVERVQTEDAAETG